MQFLCNVGMPAVIAVCCMQQLHVKPHLK